jgi:DNA-binding PadR family transcriptional regulator
VNGPLILKMLSLEPIHGFGIARRVQEGSRGVFKVNPGSLPAALQQLHHGTVLEVNVAGELPVARRIRHAIDRAE